jgi:ribosomal protein S18 acetylase RimI-like enzyme
MNVLIRLAIKCDYSKINMILEEDAQFHVDLEPDWMTDTSGISESEFCEWLDAQDKDILVLETEEEVIGLVQLRVGEGGDPGMKNKPYGWVDEIAISTASRNQGYGSKLMHAAEAWAKEKELKMLMLDVWKKNERAIAVYENQGYSSFRQRMFKEIL